MGKILALLNLFRKGEAVANKEAWKNGQITVGVLTPFIAALGTVLSYGGITLPLDETTINILSTGIISLVHVVLTVVTSESAGLAPK